MKKYLTFLSGGALLGLLFMVSGCRKALDYLEDHPTATLQACQIQQFSYKGSSTLGVERGQNDTMRFTYNDFGDPVSGIRTGVSTGYPNFFFKYDKHHRFTDLIGAYGSTPSPNTGIESWNKYFYDASGRIVKDSFYFFPTIVNGEPTVGEFGNLIIAMYEYDSKDRISKSTTVGEYPFPFVSTYAYDEKGDLIGTPHDNKINIHRTNKIWMFLDQDYSVDNPATATYTYNYFDLPTKIVPFTGTVGEFMSVSHTSLEYSEADIKYSCR